MPAARREGVRGGGPPCACCSQGGGEVRGPTMCLLLAGGGEGRGPTMCLLLEGGEADGKVVGVGAGASRSRHVTACVFLMAICCHF